MAVKVQYPGVAKGIESDIQNVMSIARILKVVPEGLYIENIAHHMKLELAEECDYVREAECGVKMKKHLTNYTQYHVPAVFQDLCSRYFN